MAKPSKMADDPRETVRLERERKAALAEAERKLKHWQEAKAEYEKLTHTTPEELAQMQKELNGEYGDNMGGGVDEGEVTNGFELALNVIGRAEYKIDPESYRKHTGYGTAEQKKMVGLFSKDGLTMEQIAEKLVEMDQESYNGALYGGDTSKAMTDLLDAFGAVRTRGGVKEYFAERGRRLSDAERERNKMENDRYAQEMGYDSYEDMLAEREARGLIIAERAPGADAEREEREDRYSVNGKKEGKQEETDPTADLTDYEKETLKKLDNLGTLRRLAEFMGKKIVIDNGIVGEGLTTDDGVIRINAKAGFRDNLIEVLGHELTHTLEDSDGKGLSPKYQALFDSVIGSKELIDWIKGMDGYADSIEGEVARRQQLYKDAYQQWLQTEDGQKATPAEQAQKLASLTLSEDAARREIVADFVGRVLLQDADMVRRMIVPEIKPATKGHWQKVLDRIKEFLNIAKGTEMEEPLSQTYQVLKEAIEYQKDRTIESSREFEKGQSYDEESVNRVFNEELQKQINNPESMGGHVYRLGKPSEKLLATGFPADQVIEMSASHLKKKTESPQHPFPLEAMTDLVKALRNPIAVFAYGKDGSKAQNAIVEMKYKGDNFLIGVHFDQGEGKAIASIRGIFPKYNTEWLSWIERGKDENNYMLGVDKAKVLSVIDEMKALFADEKKTEEYLSHHLTGRVDLTKIDFDHIAKVVKDFGTTNKNEIIFDEIKNNSVKFSISDSDKVVKAKPWESDAVTDYEVYSKPTREGKGVEEYAEQMTKWRTAVQYDNENHGNERFSIVKDPEVKSRLQEEFDGKEYTINDVKQMLEDGKTEKDVEKGYVMMYRAARIGKSGKAYSPKMTKLAGEANEIFFNEIEQSDERPELSYPVQLEDGTTVYKVNLDGGNPAGEKLNKKSRSTDGVDYNPYLHLSSSVMNDQFTAAYAMPEMGVIAVKVPLSEFFSQYKADRAASTTGILPWHSGTVQGKLNAEDKRTVALSRYDMPVGIVEPKEVARQIAEQLKNADAAMPYNLVTPEVAEWLLRYGAKVDNKPSGTVGKGQNEEWMERRKRVESEMNDPDGGGNGGNRYSVSAKKRNEDYLAAVEKGDTKTTERLVQDAAKEAMPETKVVDKNGMPLKVYHGTNHYGFTVFDTSLKRNKWNMGSHFGSEDAAAEFTDEKTRKVITKMGTYSVYLNIKNPWETSDWYFKGDPSVLTDVLKLVNENGTNEVRQMWNELYNMVPHLKKRFSEEDILNNEQGDFNYEMVHEWKDSQHESFYDKVREIVEACGYDGIKYYNGTEGEGGYSWIALHPEQIKSAEAVTYDNNGKVIPLSERFNEEKKDIRYSVSAFYSNAAKAVEDIKQTKGTGEQWLAMLKKNGGLKAEEDKWIGLSEWLKDKKSVTKDEIQKFIAENDVKVEEVHYADIRDVNLNNVYDALDAPATTNATRLKYTTEGLTNKREIALTVPNIESYNESDKVHFGDAGNGRAVAWLRFGDATDADGNKVLVIDEIQSKRHQDGREKGYQGDASKQYKVGEYETKTDKFGEYKEAVVYDADGNRVGTMVADESGYTLDTGSKKLTGKTEAEVINETFDSNNAVPDAPFQKNWHELAMKRALRYAAENGYDKVAWTTGTQQAERYELRKQLDSIEYFRNEDGTYFAFYILKGRKDGNTVGTKLTEKELVENFGKDIADKIISGEKSREREVKSLSGKSSRILSILEGDNLVIGGEGMKGFYDQILPRYMDKYGKKWGVSTHDIKLNLPNEADQVMHAVDVNDAMRESVMQGQPRFSISGKKKEGIWIEDKSEYASLASQLMTKHNNKKATGNVICSNKGDFYLYDYHGYGDFTIKARVYVEGLNSGSIHDFENKYTGKSFRNAESFVRSVQDFADGLAAGNVYTVGLENGLATERDADVVSGTDREWNTAFRGHAPGSEDRSKGYIPVRTGYDGSLHPRIAFVETTDGRIDYPFEGNNERNSISANSISQQVRDLRDEVRNMPVVTDEALKKIQEITRKELTQGGAAIVGKRDINAILSRTRQTALAAMFAPKNEALKRRLDSMLEEVRDICVGADLKAETQELIKLLNTQTHGKNQKGVTVAKNVDANTADIMKHILSTFKSYLTVEKNAEVRAKGREIRQAKEDLDALRGNGADQADIDAKEAEVATLEAEQNALKAEREQMRADQVNDSRQMIEADQRDMEAQLDEMVRDGITPSREFLNKYDSIPLRMKMIEMREAQIEYEHKSGAIQNLRIYPSPLF